MIGEQRRKLLALKNGRVADYCLVIALMLTFIISWKGSTAHGQNLHQAAREAVTQHVGQLPTDTHIQEPRFTQPATLRAHVEN